MPYTYSARLDHNSGKWWFVVTDSCGDPLGVSPPLYATKAEAREAANRFIDDEERAYACGLRILHDEQATTT